MRALVIFLMCFAVAVRFAGAANPDVQGHTAGIWSIASAGKASRWVVIHNLQEAKATGVYHIEVIQRAAKAPVWSITRIVRHMAITEAALKRSVRKPLSSGAVYPESFYDAYNTWKAENNGAGGRVCDTSVIKCLATLVK